MPELSLGFTPLTSAPLLTLLLMANWLVYESVFPHAGKSYFIV